MLLNSLIHLLIQCNWIANKGLGKFEKAIEAYKKAISIKPDYAEAQQFGNASKIRES